MALASIYIGGLGAQPCLDLGSDSDKHIELATDLSNLVTLSVIDVDEIEEIDKVIVLDVLASTCNKTGTFSARLVKQGVCDKGIHT
jgi:hypothetical protein